MIESFFGPYRFLSNFYYTTFPIVCDMGVEYPTVEHAYQACKSLDKEERWLISQLESPGDSKRYSHTMSVREDWKQIRKMVMFNLLNQKFSQPVFKQKLLDTGNEELIEGNTWHDTFWGVCDGVGTNHLGKMIMEIRKRHQLNNYLEELFHE